jgi:hypothetical protein
LQRECSALCQRLYDANGRFWRQAAIRAIVRHGLLRIVELSKGHSNFFLMPPMTASTSINQSDKVPRSPMELIEEFLYRVKTTGPLKTTKGSPDGERNYWIVSEAAIEGPKIKARIAAPGSDWMRVSDDGFWRPDVRAPFQTDDGETILMHYTGLVQQTDTFRKAAETNQPTEWRPVYASDDAFRCRGRALPVAQYVAVRRQGSVAWDG